MSVVVKNVGGSVRGAENQHNTPGGNTAMGDQGTIRLVLQGVEYVWGPNESKTLSDDLGAEAVASVNDTEKLRIVDSRDSAFSALRS